MRPDADTFLGFGKDRNSCILNHAVHPAFDVSVVLCRGRRHATSFESFSSNPLGLRATSFEGHPVPPSMSEKVGRMVMRAVQRV